MKNNNILLLLFLGLFITLNSCQKDYPKDIPKWLKEKIKEREKVCKKEGCFCKSSGIGCWTIFEWDKEGETYFLLDHGRSDVSFDQFISIYDSNGNVLCEDHYSTWSTTDVKDSAYRTVCNEYFVEATLVREIWIEDYTK